MEESRIARIHAREILDSRGNPTIEVEVTTCGGQVGGAKVPSGASTGIFEAHELRDGKKRYCGKGVENAVEKVNTRIDEILEGVSVHEQQRIDMIMNRADGTENKSKLGANSILGVSMASAVASSLCKKEPLYRTLGGVAGHVLPVPMMNVINGGAHADNYLDFQEFMIMPVGAKTFKEALRMGAEVYKRLKEILKSRGLNTAVGDEGGFAPNLNNAKVVFEILTKAIQDCGYETGRDFVFAMDAAASELYNSDENLYYFPGENMRRTTQELIDYYEVLCNEFPLVSIEDGLDQQDYQGWKQLGERLGNKCQLVGDDLFVTNKKRLREGIDKGLGNAILIKPNQIGTVTETIETIEMAKRAGYNIIISHRSGETGDTFIADLAVAVNAGQIKCGAPCRSDRVEKYNRLLAIEEELGENAVYGID